MLRAEEKSCTGKKENHSDKGYLLQAVLDSLEDELLVIDHNYRIIEANKVFLLRHGNLERHAVIGQYCYDINHGPPELCQPPRAECPLRVALEMGKTARATHAHVYYLNGEKRARYLDIIASPICDSQGKVIAVAELMRDVSEAKFAEERIAQANQNLSALNAIAAVVSQSLDLDTILNSALDKTLEIMKGSIGGILLLDEERQTLTYRVHRGLSKSYVERMSIKVGQGIAGRVVKNGKAIVVKDATTDARVANPDIILKEGLHSVISVPLRAQEKILGVLNIASHEPKKYSNDNVGLLESIAGQVAIAIENARLHREVRRQDESRGELLGQIFSIQEEERKSIARELHDQTSQSVASLAANLETVLAMLPAGTSDAKSLLKKAQSLTLSILDEIHRMTYELRPTLLDDLGLVSATRWLADNILKVEGINVEFQTSGRKRRLPPKLETGLFRVVQELINNIARHSHATEVSIVLHFQQGAICANIRDNGVGFDVEEAITTKDRPRGLGLIGMKERVALMNGTLNIHSKPGGGTESEVKISLKGEVHYGKNQNISGR